MENDKPASQLEFSTPVPDWDAEAARLVEEWDDARLEWENEEQELISRVAALARSAYAKGCETQSKSYFASALCECGHPRSAHSFFSDHDECYSCEGDEPCCAFNYGGLPVQGCGAGYRDGIQRAIQIVKAIGAEGATYNDDEILFSIITIELEKALLPAAVDENQEADSCWHCGVVVAEVPRLRCEDCPGECDLENCTALGCRAEK